MAKYGDFKYAESKYGINITIGNGVIIPLGLLSNMKVFLRDVGSSIINISGYFVKSVFKVLSGSINQNGSIAKYIVRKFPTSTLSLSGLVSKTSYVKFSGTTSIIGGLQKLTRKVMGGIVSTSGIVSTLKFYFLITIDQILLPLGIRVLRDTRAELMPSTRDNTEEIPGRNGELDFGTELKSGMLELHVATEDGLTPLQKEQNRRLYAKHLSPLNGNKILIFEDDPDKAYNVKYSGKIDINPQGSWFDFVIPFKMSDPITYSVVDNISFGSGTITNYGTIEIPLIVSISGLVTNPTVVIGGESMVYTGIIGSGHTLFINTGAMTVMLDSANAISGFNGVFPMLQPGHTTIVAASGGTTSFQWKDGWL